MLLPLISNERATSDDDLVAGARNGSRADFAKLVARHQHAVYRLARRMCDNAADAEEVVQETFLHAYRGLGAFHGDSRCSTWLHRIAVNEVLMRRRSASRRPLASVAPSAADMYAETTVGGEPPEPADEAIDRNALLHKVVAALGRLEAPQRAALILRDIEELSAEQASAMLGVSPEVVRKRASRARTKLRQELASYLGTV
jgi:RNA polymerase sigma-70 factor (ECF subfamily)